MIATRLPPPTAAERQALFAKSMNAWWAKICALLDEQSSENRTAKMREADAEVLALVSVLQGEVARELGSFSVRLPGGPRP